MNGIKRLGPHHKCRVELHHHLETSVRIETFWELMRRKGYPLPGSGSLHSLEDVVTVSEPKGLMDYLSGKYYSMPAIVNDLEALERIAYEAVEDLSLSRVAYCETRFCPFELIYHKGDHVPWNVEDTKHFLDGSDPPSAEEVLRAILCGLERGMTQFGTKVRVILACLRHRPEFSWDVLRLCEKYRDKGVVGIDVMSDEMILCSKLEAAVDKDAVLAQDVIVQVFQEARRKGIHRTVHTAESAPGWMTLVALDHFYAERLGHGYRACLDKEVYAECLRRKIHFEVCPTSSILTGALTHSTPHPLLSLVKDSASWSFSTDDPILTKTRMGDEVKYLQQLGLDEADLASAAFQGAVHSFLPENEKQDLLNHLRKTYGVE